MTTIVIDVKNQIAYADKVRTSIQDNSRDWLQTTFFGPSSLDEVVSFHSDCNKLRRTQQGYVVTGSGLSSAIEGFCDWPSGVPDCPSTSTDVLILIPRGGSVLAVKYKSKKAKHWWQKPKWVQSQSVKTEGFICLGSGSNYAEGALMAGVSPEEAIRAAAKLDVHTGDEVDSESLERLT